MLTHRYHRTGNLRWKHSYSSQEVSFAGAVYQSYPNEIRYTAASTPGLFVGVALSCRDDVFVFSHSELT